MLSTAPGPDPYFAYKQRIEATAVKGRTRPPVRNLR